MLKVFNPLVIFGTSIVGTIGSVLVNKVVEKFYPKYQ